MTRKICRFFWVLSFFVVLDETNGQVKIVSSLPDYASIAESIGGEKVEVTSIAKGYQDAHFVKAKPSFARQMSEADLFLTTGMDLELWVPTLIDKSRNRDIREGESGYVNVSQGMTFLAAIIHKFGVSVYFLRKFRAESVFRCDYKASKLVEPNRDEARAPSGNSSARRGLYICVGAGSQGTVRWDTDGASVMRRAFVRDKTMPGAPRCDEKFPEPGHRF